MSRVKKTPAISLRNVRVRETSLLVTFFTRDFGKVKAMAKGVRQKDSRLLRAYEPAVSQEILFYHHPEREIDLITDSSIIDLHSFLRDDFYKLCAACYFLDLVDEFTELHHVSHDVYYLLSDCLSYLRYSMPAKLFRYFEVQLLMDLGLFPNFEKCVWCGKGIRQGDVLFSFRQGGAVCSSSSCRNRESELLRISAQTLVHMNTLKNSDIDKIRDFKLEKEDERQLASIVQRFLLYNLGKEIRTMRFMKEIKELM